MSAIKVLLVEDDQDDARLCSELLAESQRTPIVVEVASSGKAGLELLRKKRFDVVLLDFLLPDMDGLQFLGQIDSLHFKVPVIFLTGHGDRNLQVRALEAGAADYLEKGKHLTAELLERSCLYALGLHTQRNSPGSNGPGVGELIEQLVDLTRESVRAQTENASEMRELRKELQIGMHAIQQDIGTHQRSTDKQNAAVLDEIKGLAKFRWLLDWITDHPKGSTLIFIGLILAVLLIVGALQFIDIEKINSLKKAAVGLLQAGRQGWLT